MVIRLTHSCAGCFLLAANMESCSSFVIPTPHPHPPAHAGGLAGGKPPAFGLAADQQMSFVLTIAWTCLQVGVFITSDLPCMHAMPPSFLDAG